MDKIRVDFFDVLGYLIPGSALLMVLWIGGDGKVQTIWQVYDSIHQLDNKSLLIGLLLAYIAGFVLHALGDTLYDLYRFGKIRKYAKSDVQEKWALVREYGQKHIAILERWYALRALSQNLSAVCLIAAFASLLKLVFFHDKAWLACIASTLVMLYIFLRRAVIFHHYLNDDLDAILNLRLDALKTSTKAPG